MKKKLDKGKRNDMTRLKGSMVEVNSSITAVDGNLVLASQTQANLNQEPTKNIFAKKLN